MRPEEMPVRKHSSRYSETNSLTSLGLKPCRSNVPDIGTLIGVFSSELITQAIFRMEMGVLECLKQSRILCFETVYLGLVLIS